jgi:hypothetical protein
VHDQKGSNSGSDTYDLVDGPTSEDEAFPHTSSEHRTSRPGVEMRGNRESRDAGQITCEHERGTYATERGGYGSAWRQARQSEDANGVSPKELLSAGVAVSATEGWGLQELRTRMRERLEDLPAREAGEDAEGRRSKPRKPRHTAAPAV